MKAKIVELDGRTYLVVKHKGEVRFVEMGTANEALKAEYDRVKRSK